MPNLYDSDEWQPATPKQSRVKATSPKPIKRKDITPSTNVSPKKRKESPLPECLESITDSNFHKMIQGRMETDPKGKEEVECNVAFQVLLDDGKVFLLSQLNLDQLQKLARNVGCKYIKGTRFHVRKAIMIQKELVEQMERDGKVYVADKTTNNIVRICNLIFSHEFLDNFMSLNDIKKRDDHEGKNMPKNFWQDVAEAYNQDDDDDDIATVKLLSSDDLHWDEFENLQLEEYDIMAAEVIKKKIHSLLKIRKTIQENMTKSGEHGNDAYDFVDAALRKNGKNGLTPLGVYYFFKLCDANPDVDVYHTVEMDDNLKGNTTDESVNNINIKREFSTEKKKAYASIVDMALTCKDIGKALNETNKHMLEANRLSAESTKLTTQSQLISLAQVLNKTDLLESILNKIKHNYEATNTTDGTNEEINGNNNEDNEDGTGVGNKQNECNMQ